MFDTLIPDIKAIIAAVQAPSVPNIETALTAAADLMKNGSEIFAAFFGKMHACPDDCCKTCEDFVASQSKEGMKAGAEAVPWTAIFALVQILLSKLLPVK